MKTHSFLIQNKSDFRYAIKNKNKWDCFIAAHHELEKLAQGFGLEMCKTSTLVPPSDYNYYTTNVAQALNSVDKIIGEKCHPNFKSAVMGQLARQLFWLELHEKCDKQFNQLIYFRNHSNKLLKLNEPVSAKVIYSVLPLISKVPDEQYFIDFQSPSGRKTKIFPHLKNTYRIEFTNLASFIYRALRRKNNTIYVTTTPLKERNTCVDLETIRKSFKTTAADYLFNKINSEYQNFTAHYETLQKIFKTRNLPSAVYFNFVKDTRMAACMAYFGDHGVKINMQSHGALHVFGNPNQMKISKILSNSIYNCPPSVTNVYLRSKLQLCGLPDKVNPIVKLVSPVSHRVKKNKFQVLIAPNFTNWAETPWGLHSTCHDTIKTLSHLAKIMHETPDIGWALRLKFSLSDIPHAKDLNRLQGLSRNLIHTIFQGLKNFNDVSRQSYISCIQNSDIVITEGITTVPYDAWEHCRPVLFLRSSEHVRGLQRCRDESALQYRKRGAYHSTSIEKFSKVELYELRDLYWNRPLTPNELEDVLRITKKCAR